MCTQQFQFTITIDSHSFDELYEGIAPNTSKHKHP